MDNGNIMKFTEGGFKKWGYEICEKKFSIKVFTWAQYDKIKESSGTKAADDEMNKAIKKEKYFTEEEKNLINSFLNKIKEELNN